MQVFSFARHVFSRHCIIIQITAAIPEFEDDIVVVYLETLDTALPVLIRLHGNGHAKNEPLLYHANSIWHAFVMTCYMLQKINIRATIISAILAAIVFCVPASIYINRASYRDTWLLYLGSFLFFVVIWVHTMIDSSRRKHNESTVAMVFASHVVTIAGIILSCLACFILLLLMVPGYLQPGTPEKILTGEPANSLIDKTDGLSFDIFFAATFINFSVGSFTGIVLPFALKRNQARDKRKPTPFHQQGAK